MKCYEKSNVGIVTLVSKTSSVGIIYSKSCYSTISNAQYCKNASNVSTVARIVQNDSYSLLRSLSTLMFRNIMNLTRWMLLVRTTYFIFETFQIIFPTASLIFTAAKLFHQFIWERTKHKASTASVPSITAVVVKLWIYFM